MHSIPTKHCTLIRFRVLLLIVCLSCLTFSVVPTSQAQAGAPGGDLPPFSIDPSLPSDIVVNAGQGLGQCHWLAAGIMAQPYISWGYDATEGASGWASVEPQPGVFNWAPLDAEINKARSLDKRIWLELLTTEGQTPQWAIDTGVVLIGSRGGTPVPWNETYQRLLRRAVHAMAARYDEDPTVDAINVMAGGCYGEMSICAREADTPAWEQAGYTDEKFIEAVKRILDIYLEEEYVWEDGSRTHGFLKTPVVLQLGGGLYGHTVAVIKPVVEYAVSKYGMRVWLKYNGLGGNHDMGWLYRDYATVTKVGYEAAGGQASFLDKPKQYMQIALAQHASYLCLQKAYLDIADSEWQEAREIAARYLGAQIFCQGIEAPKTVVAGQEYTFVTRWVNRGTVPLMRPERQGIKDIPASYDILIAFVDAASDSPVFEHRFTPAVPTTKWYTAQPIRIEKAVVIPPSVPAGEYDLRIALVNPDLSPEDAQRYFYLVNVSQHDGSGRYTLGHIAVRSEAMPTPAPSATPIPTVSPVYTGNPLIRFLRMIWEWLCSLIRYR
nr:beta-galactosidase [Chloroflexota bacterium]